jgi:hypothetical protein
MFGRPLRLPSLFSRKRSSSSQSRARLTKQQDPSRSYEQVLPGVRAATEAPPGSEPSATSELSPELAAPRTQVRADFPADYPDASDAVTRIKRPTRPGIGEVGGGSDPVAKRAGNPPAPAGDVSERAVRRGSQSSEALPSAQVSDPGDAPIRRHPTSPGASPSVPRPVSPSRPDPAVSDDLRSDWAGRRREAMAPFSQTSRVQPKLPEPPEVGKVHRGWTSQVAPPGKRRVPMVVADGGYLGDCWVSAASLAGARHRHDGEDRQDAYRLLAVGGVSVIAVADGVSTAPHASWGSTLATRAACETLGAFGEVILTDVIAGRERPKRIFRAVIDEADTVLRTQARQLGVPATELATTLIVVVARMLRGELHVATLYVGDGLVARVHAGDVEPIVSDESEPGTPLETFLPLPKNARPTVELFTVSAGDCVVIATDGVETDLRLSHSVREWLAYRWVRPLSAVEAAHALSYRRQGSMDDLTAVVLTPVQHHR